MRLADIRFGPRPRLEDHPRYRTFRRYIGRQDFVAYREVFERGWAESSILCGELVRLEDLPIIDDSINDKSLIAKLMGINEHSAKRVRIASEFFTLYEREGRDRFLRKTALGTEYARDLFDRTENNVGSLRASYLFYARFIQKKTVLNRVKSFLIMYEDMKRARKLVGASHKPNALPELSPVDVPWAIDYMGYIKRRDGAHRRAIANYLGWKTIPTLVFEFDRVTEHHLKDAHPYIRNNFEWFAKIVRKVL